MRSRVVSDIDPPWIITIGSSLIGFFAGASRGLESFMAQLTEARAQYRKLTAEFVNELKSRCGDLCEAIPVGHVEVSALLK
jgi:hypothetical protein